MPIPLIAIPFIAQGAKSLYGIYRNSKRKAPPGQKLSDEERLYGDELRRQTEEGKFSPATQALIRNKALQGAYGAAERGAGNINQNLSRRGFEGSAISGEAVKPLYAGAVNKAGEVASDVAIENEASKSQAFQQLGSFGERKSNMAYQNALNKYSFGESKRAGFDQGVGGLIDAGAGLYGAYNQPKPTGGGGVTQGYTGTVNPGEMTSNNANIQAFYDTSGIRIDQFTSMPENDREAFLDSLTLQQAQQIIPILEAMGY